MFRTALQVQYVVFCLVSGLFAQLPKAAEFLPLQIGNTWQYQGGGAPFEWQVVGDTLLGDTLRIYKILGQSFQIDPPVEDSFFYLNYNHDSTAALRHGDFPEDPLTGDLRLIDTHDGLDTRWEGFFGDFGATMAITDTGTISFFGTQRLWADVNTIIEESDTFRIDETYHARHVVGVGITKIGFDTLLYANIDGVQFGTPVSVKPTHKPGKNLPNNFFLSVYPNPARSQSTILMDNLPTEELEVSIYNVLGQSIRSFRLRRVLRNTHQILWDGRDDQSRIVANGVYFALAKSGPTVKIHKFTYFR